MPRVSREQMQSNRAAVVQAASELIREKGMADVTVDAISARAGLTHGSFHKQFASKQALLLEAICAAVDQRRAAVQKTVEEHGSDAPDVLKDWYLSEEHRDNPATGCAVAALVGHAATVTDDALRDAYCRAVGDLLAMVEDGGTADAFGEVALMVGALELARATKGTPLSARFLESARQRLSRQE